MYSQEEEKSLRWLSQILDILRKDCPWDKVQTTESLRYLTIEEVYELSETILKKEPDEERKELGDLFMHLLFYSKIAEDQNQFTTSDVIDRICQKLIDRHPHLALPDREGYTLAPRCENQPKWELVKMKEGRKSILEGVPKMLPPLVKAVRMQEKASGAGFDFPSPEEAFAKVKEEFEELQEALKESKNDESMLDHAEEEFGDMLFALVNWGRKLGINADDALSRANFKFEKRFRHVEEQAAQEERKISDLSLLEMKRYWNEGKTSK